MLHFVINTLQVICIFNYAISTDEVIKLETAVADKIENAATNMQKDAFAIATCPTAEFTVKEIAMGKQDEAPVEVQ